MNESHPPESLTYWGHLEQLVATDIKLYASARETSDGMPYRDRYETAMSVEAACVRLTHGMLLELPTGRARVQLIEKQIFLAFSQRKLVGTALRIEPVPPCADSSLNINLQRPLLAIPDAEDVPVQYASVEALMGDIAALRGAQWAYSGWLDCITQARIALD